MRDSRCREGRPGEKATVLETVTADTPRISRRADLPLSLDTAALDLVTMPPRERAAFVAGFECGYGDRMEREHRTYAQAIEDLARRYVVMLNLDDRIAADLAATIRRGRFDAAAERRGEPERAARQRQMLRDRGIAS